MNKRTQAAITITQTGYYDRPNDKRRVLLTEGQVLNVKWFHGDMTSYICWLPESADISLWGSGQTVIVEMENCK